jgi:ATP-dependent RNA helicase RhlE
MSFENLKIIGPILSALAKEGYSTPTPIQVQAIPPLLLGRDLIGIAQTGTGKTAAFVVPILQRLVESNKMPFQNVPSVLVLAPTRELAAQIGQSFAAYGANLKYRHTVIFGGVSQGPQVKDLYRGVDIIIATPGRLLDLMNQHRVNLRGIEYLVLDEADRMLDMGFIHDVQKIVAALPQKRQTLFFSATLSPQINELARKFLLNPVHIEVTPSATTVEKVEQCVFFVEQGNKDVLLRSLLQQEHLNCVLVFTKMKHRANKVEIMLNKNGVRADAIHGNKSQNQRTLAMQNFKTGRVRVLVATDIAARGIDIDNISHVINYDLPNEPEVYVHRIGRTARAGAAGTAYSFCSTEERPFLHDIERLTRVTIKVMEHQYHSENAKNAVVVKAAAKSQGGGHRKFRFRHSKGRSNRFRRR